MGSGSGEAFMRRQFAARQAARAASSGPPPGKRVPLTMGTAEVVAVHRGPPAVVDLFMDGGYVPGVRTIGGLPPVGSTVQVFQAGAEDRVVVTGNGEVPTFVQATEPNHPGPYVWYKTGVDPIELWVEDGE